MIGKLRKLASVVSFSLSFGRDVYAQLHLFYLLVKPFFSFSRFNPDRINFLRARFFNRPLDIFVRDNGSDVIILREMFISQDYRDSSNFFKPKIIYDIGANAGLAACYFTAQFPDAAIYGFEPESDAFRIAEMNYRNIPRGKVIKAALGAENGEVNMLSSKILSGGQKLEMYATDAPTSEWTKEKVQLRRLDEIIRSENLPLPDLVKSRCRGRRI